MMLLIHGGVVHRLDSEQELSQYLCADQSDRRLITGANSLWHPQPAASSGGVRNSGSATTTRGMTQAT